MTLNPAPNDDLADCAVQAAISLVGGKWKLTVIRTLIVDGPQRFNRLLEALASISPKVLTQNLRELEASGIVAHSTDRMYRLTESGKGLMPALHALGEWANVHRSLKIIEAGCPAPVAS